MRKSLSVFALVILIAAGGGAAVAAAPAGGKTLLAAPASAAPLDPEPQAVGALDVTGRTQGTIASARPVRAFDWAVSVPQDPQTGQNTGKRKYAPLTVTAHLDGSSVLLFKALTTNEILPKVELRLTRLGDRTPYMSVGLTNALVTNIHNHADGTAGLQDVSFTYQKITWTSAEGGMTAQDGWTK